MKVLAIIAVALLPTVALAADPVTSNTYIVTIRHSTAAAVDAYRLAPEHRADAATNHFIGTTRDFVVTGSIYEVKELNPAPNQKQPLQPFTIQIP